MSAPETHVSNIPFRTQRRDVRRRVRKHHQYRYFSNIHQSHELAVQGEGPQFQIYPDGRESHGIRRKLI